MIQPTNTTKYAHVLRPLLADEKAALRDSLSRDGLLHDLIIDQHGDLLDGYHRYPLCTELGITPRYRQVTVNDPVNWIKGLQKARRNLNREEMRQLIAEQVVANPTSSDRALARITGVSDKTVASVRSNLIASDKVKDVVRFDTKGRANPGNTQMANEAATGSPEQRRSEIPHVAEDKPKKLPPPVVMKNGRYSNLMENIVYHCADDGHFHSLANIRKKLDPDGITKLTPKELLPTLRAMAKRRDLRIELKPAAKGQKVYKIFREGRLIGLDTLKTKFGPVIKELKAQAALPISHQSSGRFLDAAGMLIQLLRDLEAE